MFSDDLARKLLLKPGKTFLLLNPPDGYGEAVSAQSEAVEWSTGPTGGQFELVQIFVRGRAELKGGWDGAVGALKPGGILWVSYPKQTGAIKSDLNRDRLRELMIKTGWRPVTQISIDGTWSALRVRPRGES